MTPFHQRRCGQIAVAAATLVALSGCLKINPEYSYLPHHGDEWHDPGTTGPSEQDAAQSSTPTKVDYDTSSPLNPSEANSQTSDSSETTASPKSGGTSHSSSTASSQSDSSSGLGPVPPSWRAIEIDAQGTTAKVESGYVLALNIDHQALVSSGAANNGSDLSIVVRRGDTIQSINRVLDPESQWNASNTKIWFAINETIDQGAINNSEYYLVLGDPSLAPVSDPTTLFLVFDDFDASNIDTSRWSSLVSSVGTKSLSSISDGLRLSARQHDSYPMVYQRVRHLARSLPNGVRIDVKSRFNYFDLSGSCGRLFPITLKSQSDSAIRSGLRINLSDYHTISYDDVQGVNDTRFINSSVPTDGPWNQYSLTWLGEDIRFFKNSAQLAQTRSSGSVKRPNQVPMQLELSAGVRQTGCIGFSGRVELDIDWVRMRPYMRPEPSARLQ